MGKRAILTLMTLGRIFKYTDLGKDVKIDLDKVTKTIVEPKKGPHYVIRTDFIKKFVRDFRLSPIDLKFEEKDVYLSTKASINGPATLTAHNSILKLNYSQMQSIFNLTDEGGADYFSKFYAQCFNNFMNGSETFAFHTDKCGGCELNYSGKLSFIFDPELKVRVIAILDYFSQIFLKKIHTGLLKNLRKFPQDRTFTQDPKSN